MPDVTISDDDAADLARLQSAANEEHEQVQATPRPAQMAYYRKLIEVRAKGATHDELADALDVTRSRPGQLLQQARKAIPPGSEDDPTPSV